MDLYNLLQRWYDFKFNSPSTVKALHSDMYFYLIDRWARLGEKSEFSLPTALTMEALGIGSYNTYKNTLADLVSFGFVKMVCSSKNQHQSNIVALSFIDNTHDKAKIVKSKPVKIQAKATVDLTLPYTSQEFIEVWNILINEPKWRKKTPHALYLNLKFLKKYSEKDAIAIMLKSIRGGYQGLFEINHIFSNQTQQQLPKL